MDLVIKICGVALLVLVPMAFGLIVSRVLGWIMSKIRKQETAK